MQGLVSWQSPSNIALIKYWGKYGVQLPRNPSISFTLENCHTITSIDYKIDKNRTELSTKFLFEGEEKLDFKKKIDIFLASIQNEFSWLKNAHLDIISSNSFPHSSGIASSAASMSALALCLESIDEKINGNFDLKRASHISRLGSGSACRSLFSKLGQWGKTELIAESSNEFAVEISENIHPIYNTFKDAVLIVGSGEKAVSSRAGHALMNDHLFAETRYLQANNNLRDLLKIMESDDLMPFYDIVEEEALSLHGLMMNSRPSFILMEPNTLNVIQAIRTARKNGLSIGFTLDAGPNIHILYPEHEAKKVEQFISDELLVFAENDRVIYDQVGNGPIQK